MKHRVAIAPSEFARQFLPEVTVDVVLLSIGSDGVLQTLLIRRDESPFLGLWALPGVFVQRDESLASAAERALRTKCEIRDVFLEQLFTFGDVDRDPRGRIISVSFYALVPYERFLLATQKNFDYLVARIKRSPINDTTMSIIVGDSGSPVSLAFDHQAIIDVAIQRIRGKLDYAPIGFELLPEHFTLFDLQRIHEAILARKLNKDSFRRRILNSGLIENTNKFQTGTSFRPAALYRFKN